MEKLSDQTALAEIVKTDKDVTVRNFAIERPADRGLRTEIATRANAPAEPDGKDLAILVFG